MLDYREFRPSPAFADRIECFWTMRQDAPGPPHRVLPDGCADIILTVDGGRAALDAVGPMTRHADYSVAPGRRVFGVRFRPGRWPAEPLPDVVLPLEDLWGARARGLLDRLAGAPTHPERARLVESALPPDSPGPVERAVAYLEELGGLTPVDALAREANLSPRQFRRVCEQRTGYSPKLLARILRFRRAHTLLSSGQPAVAVAQLCGYYDQSHLIHELHAFGAPSTATRARSGSPPSPSE